MKLLVPVSPAQVGSVKYGRKTVTNFSIEWKATPSVIVADPWPSVEASMLDEISAAIAKEILPETEVWLNGATATSTIRASFRDGWVGAILDRSERAVPTDWSSAKGRVIYKRELLPLLMRRFAGYGPVRIVWVGSAAWLDWAWTEDDIHTGIGDSGGLLGDSGLALFPVFPEDHPSGKEPEYWTDRHSELFGAKILQVGERPGAALLQALRDSESWYTLSVRVPRVAETWDGRPPYLALYDKSGRLLFRRRVAASGTRAPVHPSVSQEMNRALCRIVKRKPMASAVLVRECGGARTSEPGLGFLQIRGIRLDSGSPDTQEVSVSITADSAELPTGWYDRGRTAVLRRLGVEDACVGPIPLKASNVYFYSSSQQWIAAVGIRK